MGKLKLICIFILGIRKQIIFAILTFHCAVKVGTIGGT